MSPSSLFGRWILKKLFFKEISIYNHFDVTVLWCPEFLVGWLLLMMLAFPLIKLFMHYHLACNSVIIFTMWIPHNCFASNHNVEKPKRILLLFLLVVFNNGDGLSIYVLRQLKEYSYESTYAAYHQN